jgi:hypothetical protein
MVIPRSGDRENRLAIAGAFAETDEAEAKAKLFGQGLSCHRVIVGDVEAVLIANRQRTRRGLRIDASAPEVRGADEFGSDCLINAAHRPPCHESSRSLDRSDHFSRVRRLPIP